MRKLRTLFLLAVALPAFLSCGKDDGPGEATALGTDGAILKVEVAYTGDLSDFEEAVGLQVVSSKASTLRIEGPDMERTQPVEDAVWFGRPGVDLTASASYATSERSSAMTLTLVGKSGAPGKAVNAEIRFLADGKLIGTRKATARSDDANVFVFPFTKNGITDP